MNSLPQPDSMNEEPSERGDDRAPLNAETEDVAMEGPAMVPTGLPEPTDSDSGPPLFSQWSRYEDQPRIPHFGHLLMLGLLALVSLAITGILTRVALHYRLFGVNALTQAVTEIHYTLGTMGSMYLLTFVGSYLVFPFFWQKDFFAGLHWNAMTALRLRHRLVVAAFACFIFALLNGIFMPGPQDTPIDKIFRTPGAAWMMFAFGVTFAPFFEELIFRGFLLPALCTAYDWVDERVSGTSLERTDENGNPQWSIPAMIVGSILTSVPFAVMHGEQTSWAVGPLVLLVGVSLVLCWARLSTKSLAASVLVHASYNFMLFSIMLVGTSGFRNLEKM